MPQTHPGLDLRPFCSSLVCGSRLHRCPREPFFARLYTTAAGESRHTGTLWDSWELRRARPTLQEEGITWRAFVQCERNFGDRYRARRSDAYPR